MINFRVNLVIILFTSILFLSCKDDVVTPNTIGSIKGRVVDSQGKPVGGALIFTDPSTSSILSIDSTGLFSIPSVEQGTYKVIASKSGFNNGMSAVKVTGGNSVECVVVLGSINGGLSGGAGNSLSAGDNRYCTILDHEDLKLNGKSYTIEMWMLPKGFLQLSNWGQWLIAKGNSNSDLEYSFGVNVNRNLGFSSTSQGVLENTSSTILSANTWHHVAFVVDQNEKVMSMWVNGVLVASKAISNVSNIQSNSPLFIGARNYFGSGSGTEYWDGYIDEVRIWSVAKTQQQLISTKDQTLTGLESNLIAYWDFNEESGLSVIDKSNNGHNGVMSSLSNRVKSTAPLK